MVMVVLYADLKCRPFCNLLFILFGYRMIIARIRENKIVDLLGASTPWKMRGTGILRDFVELYL
jgi:hypothetical protein